MPSIYNRAGKRKGNRKGYHLSWTTEFSSGEIPVQVERKVKSVEEYETIRFQGIREWALPSLRVLCYRKKILATSFSSPALGLLFSVSSELNEWKPKKLLKQDNTLKHLLPAPCFMDLRSLKFWDWNSDPAINNNFHLRKTSDSCHSLIVI